MTIDLMLKTKLWLHLKKKVYVSSGQFQLVFKKRKYRPRDKF